MTIETREMVLGKIPVSGWKTIPEGGILYKASDNVSAEEKISIAGIMVAENDTVVVIYRHPNFEYTTRVFTAEEINESKKRIWYNGKHFRGSQLRIKENEEN